MIKEKWAVITGASGGIGTEITRAVAKAGYHIIMACFQLEKAERVKEELIAETGNPNLEVMPIDLSSMQSVDAFVNRILERKLPIYLLMNNAGGIETNFRTTMDGFERTVSVNYVGHYLLTRRLIPAMVSGARIVNMVSRTYPLGVLDMPDFFYRGKTGKFKRFRIYSNTKLALLLFTIELSEQLAQKGITVNATDPGIVSTDMITMHKWYDPLTNLFFRPFIRTPKQGAATAIQLLLDEKEAGVTGKLYVNGEKKTLSSKYLRHPRRKELWEVTERLLTRWIFGEY